MTAASPPDRVARSNFAGFLAEAKTKTGPAKRACSVRQADAITSDASDDDDGGGGDDDASGASDDGDGGGDGNDDGDVASALPSLPAWYLPGRPLPQRDC